MKEQKHNFFLSEFSAERITLALKGADKAGNVYDNYRNGRGVCGIVVPVTGGSEFEFSDGRKRTLCCGELAVFSEKSEYIVRNIYNDPFVHYTVNFSTPAGMSLPSSETYLKADNLAGFIDKCDRIIQYRKTPSAGGQMLAMAALYEMLAWVFSDPLSEMTDREGYKAVSPAIEYIEASYGKKITTDKLSKICMMSNTNFRRSFKEAFGVSPIEYLLTIRIRRATELITQTSLSISEIAERCGYKDVEHFCRSYKMRTGKTATAERLEMRADNIKQ